MVMMMMMMMIATMRTIGTTIMAIAILIVVVAFSTLVRLQKTFGSPARDSVEGLRFVRTYNRTKGSRV